MGLDTASTNAIIAELKARADDGMFAITATATPNMYIAGHPAAPSLRPPLKGSEPRFLVAWQAVYRLRILGQGLIVTQGNVTLAIGILAQSALDQFNLLDLNRQSFGVPTSPGSA